jgi:hypothetical protein
MREIEKLKKQLSKKEEELSKVRNATPLTHGFGTQRFAKASRKADYLAEEAFQLKKKIQQLEDGIDNN